MAGETTPYGSPGEIQGGQTLIDQAALAEEIAQSIQVALSRFGAPGHVQVVAGFAVLVQEGVTTRASVGAWLARWQHLAPQERERVSAQVARQLVQERPASSHPRPTSPTFYIDPKIAAALIAVVVLFAYGWFAAPGLGTAFDSSPASFGEGDEIGKENIPKAPPSATVATTNERASRTCATTLARILQGGTVSVADADGWLIEVAVLKAGEGAPLSEQPVLKDFVIDPQADQGSPFVWPKVGRLSTIDTTDTVVVVKDAALTPSGSHPVQSLVLSFGGTYVDAYFTESRRGAFHQIAHAIVDALGASHGAVYARCFDSEIHTLGSWFYGRDEPETVTSLLYFIGTYAKPPHLARPFYRAPDQTRLDRSFAFQNIEAHAARMDRESLATLVGAQGGMAIGSSGKGVVLTFPFTDGNRSSRMSRTTARVLSLNR